MKTFLTLCIACFAMVGTAFAAPTTELTRTGGDYRNSGISQIVIDLEVLSIDQPTGAHWFHNTIEFGIYKYTDSLTKNEAYQSEKLVVIDDVEIGESGSLHLDFDLGMATTVFGELEVGEQFGWYMDVSGGSWYIFSHNRLNQNYIEGHDPSNPVYPAIKSVFVESPNGPTTFNWEVHLGDYNFHTGVGDELYNDIVFGISSSTVAAVSAPGTFGLLLVGIFGLVWSRRRAA